MTFVGRTLFVGIGAPKAGTSWLYGYLRRHPAAFLSPVKELHHFNTRYGPDLREGADEKSWDDVFRERAAEMKAKYNAEPTPERRRQLRALKARIEMIDDPSAYMRYFRHAAQPEHKIMGEMTPGYCTLGDEGFQAIRQQSQKLRVLFLMRDPVDRFWSSLRSKQKRSNGFDAIAQFETMLTDFPLMERGKYDRTLQALDRNFAPEEIKVEFYERLFTEEAIKGICEWLGIRFRQPDFERKVNVSPQVDLPPVLAAKAQAALAPVYDYCRARFGDHLPKSWLA